MLAQNKTFTGRRIYLDDGSFHGCTFDTCHFVVSGYAPGDFQGCTFNDCKWEFIGPAKNTIDFMKAMHTGGATDLIEATCRAICGQAPGRGPSLH